MQNRFSLLEEEDKNQCTVAGIRDVTLGRVKDGNPVDYSIMFSSQNHGFKKEKVRDGLYKVDVLGGVIQDGTNHEYRKFGKELADYLIENEKTAVLISSYEMGHYLLDESDICESSTSFVLDNKEYFITVIENSHLKEYIPDILESEEFVYGLNVWLCLFDNKPVVADIETVEEEMTKLIRNLCELYNWKMNIEMLAGSSDECEVLWFEPQTTSEPEKLEMNSQEPTVLTFTPKQYSMKTNGVLIPTPLLSACNPHPKTLAFIPSPLHFIPVSTFNPAPTFTGPKFCSAHTAFPSNPAFTPSRDNPMFPPTLAAEILPSLSFVHSTADALALN
ncbi:hypothetical protein GCK72_015636 [Caenorhabditis remanei]|uniref:Uncharacterized protein n=1 Tax=Caenorhabditis remanei TaxID=31234 RepID=A0A6A5GXC8_CAERE|nr:hypothetical protein GCK72_015636 [Caenorhabditis remanei]KAF1759175.1 hypothetical protein GCK72_015636 [Caenorhabditis remanei]